MTPFSDTFLSLRREMDQALDKAVPLLSGPESRVVEAARYSLLGEGKRLRPALLLATGDMFGLPHTETLPYACALEMIHTYSLIHDDLPCMDDDDLRRGRPTCHKQYDEATAVLAGDMLLNKAFELLFAHCSQAAGPPGWQARVRAASRIAGKAGIEGMIGGQAIDMRYEKTPADEDSLRRMHRMKTGALLEAALLVPADLADPDPVVVRALEMYAEQAGLAFQIGDDLLDATATAEQLGKTPGKDARDHKSTFVSLLGLTGAKDRLRETVERSAVSLGTLREAGLDATFLEGLTVFMAERDS